MITGDCGKLVLENGKLKRWRLREPEREFCFRSEENFAQIPCDYEEYVLTERETAHAGILQNWANAILREEPLISPGRDALNELTLSNAACLSQWTGNVPVALPLNTAAFDQLLAERIAASSTKQTETAIEGRTQYSQRWQVNW